jgi:hypothetical protein
VVGVRIGADTTSSKVTSWSVGINYNRMVAADGPGTVERLSGQQVRAVGGPRSLHTGKKCKVHGGTGTIKA